MSSHSSYYLFSSSRDAPYHMGKTVLATYALMRGEECARGSDLAHRQLLNASVETFPGMTSHAFEVEEALKRQTKLPGRPWVMTEEMERDMYAEVFGDVSDDEGDPCEMRIGEVVFKQWVEGAARGPNTTGAAFRAFKAATAVNVNIADDDDWQYTTKAPKKPELKHQTDVNDNRYISPAYSQESSPHPCHSPAGFDVAAAPRGFSQSAPYANLAMDRGLERKRMEMADFLREPRFREIIEAPSSTTVEHEVYRAEDIIEALDLGDGQGRIRKAKVEQTFAAILADQEKSRAEAGKAYHAAGIAGARLDETRVQNNILKMRQPRQAAQVASGRRHLKMLQENLDNLSQELEASDRSAEMWWERAQELEKQEKEALAERKELLRYLGVSSVDEGLRLPPRRED